MMNLTMNTNLQGRVALITGGAVRLGQALVERLADEGCKVVIHYRSSDAPARRLQQRLKARGVAAVAVRARLDSQKACEGLIKAALKAHGQLDILINSAAVFTKEPMGGMTGDSLQAAFWPNLFAPMLLTQAFAAACAEGQVINLLDRRIASHDTACIPYLMTKKALAAFTEVSALALAPRIRVNAVAPGPVLPPPGQGARYLRDHAGRLPLGRAPTTADIADAVVALLGSRSTTGQIVFVDGGQHLLGNGV